jgi:hypothetical protein
VKLERGDGLRGVGPEGATPFQVNDGERKEDPSAVCVHSLQGKAPRAGIAEHLEQHLTGAAIDGDQGEGEDDGSLVRVGVLPLVGDTQEAAGVVPIGLNRNQALRRGVTLENRKASRIVEQV